MATSGTYDYSVTASTVITETLEQLCVIAQGETPGASDVATCLRSLNLLAKQWSGNFDFAPGFKAFSRKTGYLFLQKNQGVYNLGPSGDHATLSYVRTTLSTDEATSSTSIGIMSATGMSASDNIGIELDDGTIHWTTISGAPSTTTTIATGLASAATAGNSVFAYTAKLIRPLYIENAARHDVNSIDSAFETMTSDYYDRIGNKIAVGTPSRYRYDNLLTNGKFYLDTYPSVTNDVIRLTFMATAQNYDSSANDIAFPQEWFLPLALGLGKIVAPKFESSAWTPLLESNYQEAVAMARSSYAENTEIYFQPGLD
jgi:hypothetical protein